MQKPATVNQRGSGAYVAEDPTPTLNNYIRTTLGKGESPTYAEQLQGLGSLKNFDEKQSETILRQLSRLIQYGHLTIAAVQLALQMLPSDLGRDEKALMRIVQYVVTLGLGDGSAGTPLPVPPQAAAGLVLAKAVDRLGLEVLVAAWNDLGAERASFGRKQAALRALAAVTRASLSSRPEDGTYAQGLYETLRGLLDKVDALRAGRRGLAHFISQAQASKRKNLMADVRQRAEMWGLLRMAFSAARLALPRSGLYKVAQRSLSALGSSDPVAARHALALASLVARDPAGSGSFIAAVEPLLRMNVEAAKRTGSLHQGILPPKRAGPSGDPTGPGADSEGALNLRDMWARVYLARACAAVIQSGHIAGDVSNRGSVFWQALLLLALADPSERVALEAIRAMFGAPYPRATSAAAMRQPGAGSRLPTASTPAEVEHEAAATKILGASWHLLMTQALEPPPDLAATQQDGGEAAATPAGGSSLPPAVKAAAASGGGGGSRASDDVCVFGRLGRRLLRCLSSRSHSLVCGAARAVAVAAESRAWFHALSGGHGHEAEPEVVRRWMRMLAGFLTMLAGDETVSGCERAAALEALVWYQGLDQPPTLSAGLMLKAAGHGGFTAPPIARYTFADPWPECLLAELLGVLARRLRCGVGLPPEAVLELAGGLAAGAPGAMPREALAGLWDLAPGPVAARSALQLLSAPLPPLCQPPALCAVEVKAMACQAEAGWNGLKALAACWLGEHIDSIAGEYAWKSWEHRMGPGADDDSANGTAGDGGGSNGVAAADGAATGQADGGALGEEAAMMQGAASLVLGGGAGGGGVNTAETSVVRMAVAAAAHNPLLAMTMAHLNRAVLAGAPVVRTAAAQAISKIAVRSGEPYRIQCYTLLAAAVGRAAGGVGGGCGVAGGYWPVDPLGLAPVVDPALEVLDAMYAGELVLERHIGQYGSRARDWPRPALESLRRRHEWLLGAIAGCVAAVPRELFMPLGPRSRRLLFPDEKEDAEEDARAVAAQQAAQQQQQPQTAGAQYDNQQYDEFGRPYQYDYSKAEENDYYGDYYASQQQQEGQPTEQRDAFGQQQDPLARYDFSGQKAAAAVELNWGGERSGTFDGTDAMSDDAVADARPAVVLYAFTAETEGEVSVSAGDSVRVIHDLGEWFQILTAAGHQGLVPASYIQLLDEHAVPSPRDARRGGGLQGQGSGGPMGLQSQASVGSTMSAGGLSGQASLGGRQGDASAYGFSYGASSRSASAGGAAGAGTADYYQYQYENPEYDGGNNYGSYYGDYNSGYGADQYGSATYTNNAYEGGMYGGESTSTAAAAGGRGGGKKGGFGGFDDFGAVLAEAKNAAAAARQQQTTTLLDNAAANSSTSTSTSAAIASPSTQSAGKTAPAAGAAGPATSGSFLTDGVTTTSLYGNQATAGQPGTASPATAPAPALPATSTAAAAVSGGGRGTALYEFAAEMEGELSVAAGEELEIVQEEAEGWITARVVTDPARQGLIPASYVRLL